MCVCVCVSLRPWVRNLFFEWQKWTIFLVKILRAVKIWHCWICLLCPRMHRWPVGPVSLNFLFFSLLILMLDLRFRRSAKSTPGRIPSMQPTQPMSHTCTHIWSPHSQVVLGKWNCGRLRSHVGSQQASVILVLEGLVWSRVGGWIRSQGVPKSYCAHWDRESTGSITSTSLFLIGSGRLAGTYKY